MNSQKSISNTNIFSIFHFRDVKYIWHRMSYLRLTQVLKEAPKLRAFPLVDNPGSMILLGSIQRVELVNAISELIGKERRHQVCIQRYGAKLKQLQLQEQREMQQRIDDEINRRAAKLKQEEDMAAAIER